jgi:preprotein translocase subunit YajC
MPPVDSAGRSAPSRFDVLQEWLHGFVAQQAEGPGILGSAVPFLLIFAVMYFLIIRPQQKQAKEQQGFLAQLKKGDEVVLQSGLFGRIVLVGDTDLTVEIAPNVKVRVLKSAVATGGKALEAKSSATDAKPEADKS